MQSAANPIVSLTHLGYIGILIEMRQIERGNYMLSIAKLLSLQVWFLPWAGLP